MLWIAFESKVKQGRVLAPILSELKPVQCLVSLVMRLGFVDPASVRDVDAKKETSDPNIDPK